MTDPAAGPATAVGGRALILVGTEPRSGMTLPLGTILDVSTAGNLAGAVAGWTRQGWTDVHPALEYLTYRRLTMAEATRYLQQNPTGAPTPTTEGAPHA